MLVIGKFESAAAIEPSASRRVCSGGVRCKAWGGANNCPYDGYLCFLHSIFLALFLSTSTKSLTIFVAFHGFHEKLA